MNKAPPTLLRLARETIEPMGYEVVGMEYQPRATEGAKLRVYIDHPDGIQLEDCETVSRQFGAVLDVEDPIRGEYDLEISSPGLDRPLFEKRHFEQYIGREVKISLKRAIDGRRRFRGTIRALEGDSVVIGADGREVRMSLTEIDKARLVPEF
jgi:ribosome maturation factor RimP